MSLQEVEPFPRAELLGHLEFGLGEIGKGAVTQESEMGLVLGQYTRPLTVHKTADCVDGRIIVCMADPGVSEADIYSRVAEQLPGGLVFAVTCAAIGADMAIVRDAKTFKQAYLTMHDILTSFGYQDSGHVDCGASKKLAESVEKEVDLDVQLSAMGVLRPLHSNSGKIAKLNSSRKSQLLLNGFYSGWDNHFHEEFLHEKAPQNFATLERDNTPLAGHYEELALAIKKQGFGLAKNPLVKETGHMAFGLTTPSPTQIIRDIGPRIKTSPLELARFLYEFDASGINVLNVLAAKGLAVYGI